MERVTPDHAALSAVLPRVGSYVRSEQPCLTESVGVDVSAAVRYWFQRDDPEVARTGWAQIDLDEMFDEPPVLALQTALACIDLAVAQVRQSQPDVDGLVTVPLEPSDDLTTQTPELTELIDQPWTYGPGLSVPGLYLLQPSIWREYEECEDYRRSLLAGDALKPGYAAYYRCWRSSADAKKGWEFERTVYIRTI